MIQLSFSHPLFFQKATCEVTFCSTVTPGYSREYTVNRQMGRRGNLKGKNSGQPIHYVNSNRQSEAVCFPFSLTVVIH